MWRRGPIGIAGLLAGLIAVGPAAAYDTGPHFDITRDALAAEGFGEKAIQIAQVTNWMVDLYENAGIDSVLRACKQPEDHRGRCGLRAGAVG